MSLEAWRLSFDPKLTLASAAERLGIQGSNPARRYQRYETGENAVDVALALQMVRLTDGAVSVEDLARTREDWLARKKDGSLERPRPVPSSGAPAQEGVS